MGSVKAPGASALTDMLKRSPSSSLLFGGVFGGDRFSMSVRAEAPGALTDDGLLSGDTGSETSSMMWWCSPSAFLTGDLSSSVPRLKYDSREVCVGRWRGGETLLAEALSERAYDANSAVSSRTLRAVNVLSTCTGGPP